MYQAYMSEEAAAYPREASYRVMALVQEAREAPPITEMQGLPASNNQVHSVRGWRELKAACRPILGGFSGTFPPSKCSSHASPAHSFLAAPASGRPRMINITRTPEYFSEAFVCFIP